jgi:hypothetical protein
VAEPGVPTLRPGRGPLLGCASERAPPVSSQLAQLTSHPPSRGPSLGSTVLRAGVTEAEERAPLRGSRSRGPGWGLRRAWCPPDQVSRSRDAPKPASLLLGKPLGFLLMWCLVSERGVGGSKRGVLSPITLLVIRVPLPTLAPTHRVSLSLPLPVAGVSLKPTSLFPHLVNGNQPVQGPRRTSCPERSPPH